MDTMFNDGSSTFSTDKNRQDEQGRTLITVDDNDEMIDVVGDEDRSTPMNESSQSSMNKRKLVNVETNQPAQQSQDTENTKRLCAANGHHH